MGSAYFRPPGSATVLARRDIALGTAEALCGAPCSYEFQMQYGSIGWSVGALLGYQAALHGSKRVLAFIGDGSFQVTAQVGDSAPVRCRLHRAQRLCRGSVRSSVCCYGMLVGPMALCLRLLFAFPNSCVRLPPQCPTLAPMHQSPEMSGSVLARLHTHLPTLPWELPGSG